MRMEAKNARNICDCKLNGNFNVGVVVVVEKSNRADASHTKRKALTCWQIPENPLCSMVDLVEFFR